MSEVNYRRILHSQSSCADIPVEYAFVNVTAYNRNVARGWESKSVESQIESAGARRTSSHKLLKAEQIEIERKRDGLLLHRTRVLHDLAACRDDRYRKTLESGLAYLETQLAGLGWRREA